MGVVYLPTWKPQMSTIHVGKYTVRPMDPSWEKNLTLQKLLFWGPPNTPAMQVQTLPLEGPRIHRGGKKKPEIPWQSHAKPIAIEVQRLLRNERHLCPPFVGHVLRLVDLQIQKKGVLTLPETNELHLKMDGWNMIVSFWEALFSGANCWFQGMSTYYTTAFGVIIDSIITYIM